MIQFLGHFQRLSVFKLSNNNLRGGNGGVDLVLKCLGDCASLKHLDLSNNLLGQNYGPQFSKRSPPICLLGDVLIKSPQLEHLDISNNEMELKSALCIAHGLTHTQTLKYIDVHSNPIGKFGMRQLITSINNN